MLLWFCRHTGCIEGSDQDQTGLDWICFTSGGQQGGSLTITEVLPGPLSPGPPSPPPPVVDHLFLPITVTSLLRVRITFSGIRPAGFCLFRLDACNFCFSLQYTVASYFSLTFVPLKPMAPSRKLDHGWDSAEWVVGVKPFPPAA